MVKIRLTRLGDKKSPFYRLIVADSRAPRDGSFIDVIGSYNPIANPSELKIDAEKAKKWLANGAQPTDTARALMASQGIMEAKKLPAKTSAVKKKKGE